MKKKTISKSLMITGALLLCGALGLSIYNIWDENQSRQNSDIIVNALEQEMAVHETDTDQLPDYVLDPYMEMPEQEIDGIQCIGIVEIPALDVKAPILKEWSYPNLKIAPCRYEGSMYLDHLILCAHNYAHHFGLLKRLNPGDDVYVSDTLGNVFHYQIDELESLLPTDVELMKEGNWDLTLFTCTPGGASRVTARCHRVHEG